MIDNACPDLLGRDCDGGDLPAQRDVPDNDPMRVRGSGVDGRRDVYPLREPLATEAQAIINGPRQAAYGPPEVHLAKVAGVWTQLLGTPIDAHTVAICLSALKLVRESHRPMRDNRLDALAYMELAERVADPDV